MKLFNRLAQDRRFIHVLMLVSAAELIIILLLSFALIHIPTEFKIYQYAGLDSIVTERAGETRDFDVYAFTSYVWQTLNAWPHDGKADYLENLTNYGAFLTPEFKHQLYQNYKRDLAQETGRVRFTQMVPASAFSSSDVVKRGEGVWEVKLKVHLTEYANGLQVKNIIVTYPLKVIRFDSNPNANPWGLLLAGVYGDAVRDKTILKFVGNKS